MNCAPTPACSPEVAVPVVLVHGGGSTSRFWDRVVPLLAPPVVAVDVPGRRGAAGDVATMTLDDSTAAVLAASASVAPTGPQDEMIARLPAPPEVVAWVCGHLPAVTRPGPFAALVEEHR